VVQTENLQQHQNLMSNGLLVNDVRQGSQLAFGNKQTRRAVYCILDIKPDA